MSSTKYEPTFPPDWDAEDLEDFVDDPMNDLPDSNRLPPFAYP